MFYRLGVNRRVEAMQSNECTTSCKGCTVHAMAAEMGMLACNTGVLLHTECLSLEPATENACQSDKATNLRRLQMSQLITVHTRAVAPLQVTRESSLRL